MKFLSSKNRNIGIILSYTNTFLSLICGLFLSSFLLTQLGKTNYGVYQTMSSFANYLVLLEFGTGTVMTRNLLACRNKNEDELTIKKNVSTIWSIASFLSIIIAIVSVVFYFSIETIYKNSLTPQQIVEGKKIFIFIIIFLVSSFLSQTLNGIPLAHENYTYSSLISIVKILLRTSLLIILLLRFEYVIIIAIVDATINTGIAIFGYIYCKLKYKIDISFRNFDRLILKAALPMCIALFLQTIVNQANNTVGKFVLGVMTSPEDVTLYSVGLYIFSIFSSLTTIPVSMYMPQISKDVLSGKEGKELTNTLIQPCRLIVLVGGSVLFGFISAGKPFIKLIYGEEYLLAWLIAITLMAPMFLNMSNAVIINVLDIKNKRLSRSLIMMVSTIFNIVLTIFLIKKFGVVGASIATGFSTILQIILLNVYYYKRINIKVLYLYYKTYKGILVYQIVGAIIGCFVCSFIKSPILAFLTGGVTYVFIAFSGFLIFGKNQQEKVILSNLLYKLFKKR